ncbi:hypothetical protein RRG08_055214 [Elysia crispata]|uniref:Uncharacterized protein n=1 Tax=Elysia crispata TaxID=231223 RepID=A0AAE0XT16_9GAST|nr:hypothetical protein RRG08_055214 [Elysia crispata]
MKSKQNLFYENTCRCSFKSDCLFSCLHLFISTPPNPLSISPRRFVHTIQNNRNRAYQGQFAVRSKLFDLPSPFSLSTRCIPHVAAATYPPSKYCFYDVLWSIFPGADFFKMSKAQVSGSTVWQAKTRKGFVTELVRAAGDKVAISRKHRPV